MSKLAREITNAYNESGTRGVSRLLRRQGLKVSQDGHFLVKTSQGAPEQHMSLYKLQQYARLWDLPDQVMMADVVRDIQRIPA